MRHNSCEVLFIAAYVPHALFMSSLPSFLMQLRLLRCTSVPFPLRSATVALCCLRPGPHCCRRCPSCRSRPRSRRWPSTGRTRSWGWGSSCRKSSWLPAGRRCRCRNRCLRWQSSSKAGQRWGRPACPAHRGWNKGRGHLFRDGSVYIIFALSFVFLPYHFSHYLFYFSVCSAPLSLLSLASSASPVLTSSIVAPSAPKASSASPLSPPSLPPFPPSAHLHVSLQLQQMKSVPSDEAGALVGEVDAAKAGLARPEEGFTDRVVVAPNKVVVNGDVLKLRGVAVGPEHLLVPAGENSILVDWDVWELNC